MPPTYKYFVDIVNILRDMRPEKLTDKSILCGSPQHIVDTLKQVEKAGIAEVILYFNYGQMPHAEVKAQMDRFMREVAPHFDSRRLSSSSAARTFRPQRREPSAFGLGYTNSVIGTSGAKGPLDPYLPIC